ncbi:peptidase S41-like protein [Larkinella arboricola]|uniref:Peptidase S41-like protein n=1 Tax=Larkinella arboricola TaxID=643671 RepID=A0A327WGE6_LARAB|nr:S41 family peptidase [Larkinella arboricola]RAJ90037.1 peptidase S41-like protein [Larkinella arboricola]
MFNGIFYFFLLFGLTTVSSAQDHRLSAIAMREDFQFIREQVFNVHANPFSQLTKQKYNAYFDSLETGLNQPLAVADFQRKVSLALIPLGDEHAAISIRNAKAQKKTPSWADSVATNLSYQRLGTIGYLFARSFATRSSQDLAVYERCIDSLFTLIRRDSVTRLVIDVSRNEGGASAVGTMIIKHIFHKPYKSYSMSWKRSEAYLAKLSSWGFHDEMYQKALPGELLQFPATTVVPGQVANPFKGKVIVIIGPQTFSSAIMFATLVQDNKMALLAGESPVKGHPTHFGEMYSTLLPNSQLEVRFGVKEWIRPAGRGNVNKLVPDLPCKLPTNKDLPLLVKQLQW